MCSGGSIRHGGSGGYHGTDPDEYHTGHCFLSGLPEAHHQGCGRRRGEGLNPCGLRFNHPGEGWGKENADRRDFHTEAPGGRELLISGRFRAKERTPPASSGVQINGGDHDGHGCGRIGRSHGLVARSESKMQQNPLLCHIVVQHTVPIAYIRQPDNILPFSALWDLGYDILRRLNQFRTETEGLLVGEYGCI